MTDDWSVAGSVGSPSAPSGLMVLVAEDDFYSDPEFCWDGDDDGINFDPPSRKSNNSVALYLSCSHVAMVVLPPSLSNTMTSSPVAGTSRCLVLPKNLHTIINRVSRASISPGPGRRLAVADSGATDHMFPNKEAFISYKSIQNLQVRMGNNSFLPVIGRGTAILSLNDQQVLVQNALHVPGLAVPLYSLRAHLKQRGFGFIGTSEAGILVYFPTFVLSVDTSSNCHLSYKPLGRSAPLDTLHYVQPWCSHLNLYPSKLAASSITATPSPHVIEDEDSQEPSLSSSGDQAENASVCVAPPSSPSPVDLSTIASQLQSIATSILLSPASSSSPNPPKTPTLLSPISRDETPRLLYHPDTSFPDVRPCDTANASDTKIHWSSEEINRVMGC